MKTCSNKIMEPINKEHSNFIEKYEPFQLNKIYFIIQLRHKKNF